MKPNPSSRPHSPPARSLKARQSLTTQAPASERATEPSTAQPGNHDITGMTTSTGMARAQVQLSCGKRVDLEMASACMATRVHAVN